MTRQSTRTRGLSDLVERILEARASSAGAETTLANAIREFDVTQPPAASAGMRLPPAARERIRRVLAERWRELLAA